MPEYLQLEPSVSIIVPAHNSAKYLAETLASVQRQSLSDWECLVIDDNSTDETAAIAISIANNDPRIKLILGNGPKPRGPSFCRNRGLEAASGKYIQFFDSDDLMAPSMLEQKLRIIEQCDADVAICTLVNFWTDANAVVRYAHPRNLISSSPLSDQISGLCGYFVSGPLWKARHLLNHSIQFDEHISNMEDLDFNIRAIHVYPCKLQFVDEPLIYYRRHSNSTSSAQSLYNRKCVSDAYYVRAKIFRMLPEMKDTDIRTVQVALGAGFVHGLMMASGARSLTYMLKNYLSICRLHKASVVERLNLIFAAIVFCLFRRGSRLFARQVTIQNGFFPKY